MLGQEERRIYLNISGGKIVRRTDRGPESFDFVEGILDSLSLREREFRGERVPYWYLDLRDPQTGDLYTLGLGARSGAWRSLVLALGSCKDFGEPIRITPYTKGGYERVSVYQGGKRLDWVSDLPPVEEIEVQGQKVKSTQKRDSLILGIAQEIQERLQERK